MSQDAVKSKRGGARPNSGPKKGEPWTRVSVPNSILAEVREMIAKHKAEKRNRE